VLPPGFAGYEPYCPWSKTPGKAWNGPDLARARQLVKESGTAGQKVTVVASDRAIDKQIGLYMQSVLRELGYDAALKTLSNSLQFTYIQNTKNQVQISVTAWYQDYPAPSNFLNVLFSCAGFHEGSDASVNIPGLCDKELDAEMARAMSTAITDPKAAAAIWAGVDRRVTDGASVAVLINPKQLDFVSKRLGNYTFSGQTYFMFAKAWVK